MPFCYWSALLCNVGQTVYGGTTGIVRGLILKQGKLVRASVGHLTPCTTTGISALQAYFWREIPFVHFVLQYIPMNLEKSQYAL